MKYRIINVRRGYGTCSVNVYATLIDSKGWVVISATLIYILVTALARGYEITNVEEFYQV